MKKDLEVSLAKVFRDATMESVAIQLRTDDDWDKFNAIRHLASARETQELQSFERDKPKLVAKAREELIHRAGSLTFEHPAPFGTDRFNKDAINDQAQKLVDHAHQARLLKIQNEETEGFATLKDDILARETVRGHAQQSFARATERRSSPERRHPNRTQ